MRILFGIDAVETAKDEARKSGIIVTEGLVNLPESEHFVGKFASEKQGEKLVCAVQEITYTDKADNKQKVFYKAANSVKLRTDNSEEGKTYEGGVPYESVKELLSNPINLSKDWDFRTTPKSKSGRVYMELVN
jgi:hypothetical protein